MLRVRDVSVAAGGGAPAPHYLKSNGLDVGFPLSVSLTLRKLFRYSVFRRQQDEILRSSSGLMRTHAHTHTHSYTPSYRNRRAADAATYLLRSQTLATPSDR